MKNNERYIIVDLKSELNDVRLFKSNIESLTEQNKLF